ncbi:MAG: Colicin V production protein [uncultured Sulfurovum sp.]|uniref:Colicin V production protein n=1 Tax=uncultured Sulfurovum sp. TaxID=269237 RepID=A0A6S6S633_9BACT|nr:MAG: Colicin V production protein [uncultured Sulfurovum sp.]
MENLSLADFTYFDMAIAAIILLLAIKGFLHGFIKELFSLVGLVGGVYFASRLSEDAAAFIDTNFLHLENTSLLKLIGFISILIIIWLSATIIGAIIAKITSGKEVGFFSRVFGFVTSGLKYFLIFGLIFTALSNVKLVKDNLGDYVKDSILYPHLTTAGAYLINLDENTQINETATTTIDTVEKNIEKAVDTTQEAATEVQDTVITPDSINTERN